MDELKEELRFWKEKLYSTEVHTREFTIAQKEYARVQRLILQEYSTGRALKQQRMSVGNYKPNLKPEDLKLPRGKSFECQEKRPWLKVGSVVVVQPGSLVTKPYLCIIKESEMDWCHPEKPHISMRFTELCTHVPFKHGAVIWEYWADRLSPANWIQTKYIQFLYFIERILK